MASQLEPASKQLHCRLSAPGPRMPLHPPFRARLPIVSPAAATAASSSSSCHRNACSGMPAQSPLLPALERSSFTSSCIKKMSVVSSRELQLGRSRAVWARAAADGSAGPSPGEDQGEQGESDSGSSSSSGPAAGSPPPQQQRGPRQRAARPEPGAAPSLNTIPSDAMEHGRHISFLTAPMGAAPSSRAQQAQQAQRQRQLSEKQKEQLQRLREAQGWRDDDSSGVGGPSLSSIPKDVTRGSRHVSMLTAPWASRPEGSGARRNDGGASRGSDRSKGAGVPGPQPGRMDGRAGEDNRNAAAHPAPLQLNMQERKDDTSMKRPLIRALGPGVDGPGEHGAGRLGVGGGIHSSRLVPPAAAGSVAASRFGGDVGRLQRGGGGANGGGGSGGYGGGGGRGGRGEGPHGWGGEEQQPWWVQPWALSVVVLVAIAAGIAMKRRRANDSSRNSL